MRHPEKAPRDQGAALVLTLFATTLVMIVGTTILSITVNDLRSARLSRDSAAALDSAEAGVAQLAAHVRTYGISSLGCGPTECTGYAAEAAPVSVALEGGRGYEVWVEPVAPLPTHNPGVYLVHSTGRAGDGVRELEVEITVGTQPIGLPLAIFARSVDGGGDAAVTRESIISTGCVFSRRQIRTEGVDVAFGINAAVHSAQYVSTSNGNNRSCGPTSGAVHRNGACNTEFPWDQSVQGGSLAGKADCAQAHAVETYYGTKEYDGDADPDVVGSRIKNEASLRRLFGIPDQPFTDAQLDNLRAMAEETGTYFDTAGYAPSEIPARSDDQPHLVVFFDLEGRPANERLVDLKDVNGWARPASPACPEQSLLVVVVGGDVRLNGNQAMVANIVLTSPAPYGHVFKANGTADLIGTIYADSVDLTGTVDISLDDCFLQNLSPGLIDTTLVTSDYREVDRTDRP